MSTSYDLVILNGRVMDPETLFDAIANVGINGGRIAKITTETSKWMVGRVSSAYLFTVSCLSLLSFYFIQFPARKPSTPQAMSSPPVSSTRTIIGLIPWDTSWRFVMAARR
mmetsp:Transcript_16075/g.29848  ORF Transcript_16075/g.29848 Transcript_16075/m.29848 type:complete len:111 (-) Transcript_16075:1399-1731(-)